MLRSVGCSKVGHVAVTMMERFESVDKNNAETCN